MQTTWFLVVGNDATRLFGKRRLQMAAANSDQLPKRRRIHEVRRRRTVVEAQLDGPTVMARQARRQGTTAIVPNVIL